MNIKLGMLALVLGVLNRTPSVGSDAISRSENTLNWGSFSEEIVSFASKVTLKGDKVQANLVSRDKKWTMSLRVGETVYPEVQVQTGYITSGDHTIAFTFDELKPASVGSKYNKRLVCQPGDRDYGYCGLIIKGQGTIETDIMFKAYY